MSGKYCVDANIFITAWYRSYPPHIFSPIWNQIVQHRDDIVLIKPVFDEIEPILSSDSDLSIQNKREKYPLRVWLEESRFAIPDISDEVNVVSLDLEREYETDNTSKGAGQIDITLIAYAKVTGKTVVTLEAKQNQKPDKKSKYKIPLICKELGVLCIDFIEMLDELDIRIK